MANEKIKCTTSDTGIKRCYTRIKKGDQAPFDGILADNQSIAYAKAEKDFASKLCKIDKDSITNSMNLKLSYKDRLIELSKSENKKIEKLLLKSLDVERENLSNCIKKKDKSFFGSYQFWISVGFAVGVVSGSAIAYGGAWAWGVVGSNYQR